MTEPFIKRCLRALWTERSRVLYSGLGALLLWFLLGQKVEKSEIISVEVRCISADEDWPQGGGLIIRVPSQLALSDVQPRSLDLKVKGTAEEIARLDHSLRGTYQVPADFLGDQEKVTQELEVSDKVFRFGQLQSIELIAPEKISLTLARRYVDNLPLSAANLTFSDPTLGRDVQVDFEPTMIRISGPADQARLVREDPGLFQLPAINPEAFRAGLRGRLAVPARLGAFDRQAGRLERMSVEDQLIRITLTPRRRFREIVLDDLEVLYLVPENARREGANRERPLSLQPETVKVSLRVPEEFFSEGGDEAAIRNRLNLFVDLGEMPFPLAAENLPVHFEGYPEGATVSADPALIDVTWNIPETPEPKDESNP